MDREPQLAVRPFPHGGKARHLAIWFPPGFAAGQAQNPPKRWPLVLFLHGRGECGTEGSKHTAQGLIAAAQLAPERWGCIIIAPQKQATDAQWVQDEPYVLACLDQATAELPVDASRIYLTGLSQGGAGTWAIGARNASRFAAMAPICGYGDPAGIAQPLANMPIWAFHGLADDVVPPVQSRGLINAVIAARSAGSVTPLPKLTELEGVNHNSWDPAYRQAGSSERASALWEWMSGFVRRE